MSEINFFHSDEVNLKIAHKKRLLNFRILLRID